MTKTFDDKASSLSSWGVSLMNKLPPSSRNRLKRDASKRRRKNDAKAAKEALRDGRVADQ